jgi:hypothetical protein
MAHHPVYYPLFEAHSYGKRREATVLYADIQNPSKLDNSDQLLKASFGLLKVDDVPDRGKVLHEQICHSCTGKKV